MFGYDIRVFWFENLNFVAPCLAAKASGQRETIFGCDNATNKGRSRYMVQIDRNVL